MRRDRAQSRSLDDPFRKPGAAAPHRCCASDSVRHRRRPPRFELQLDAWYRTTGETGWHHGVPRSVSRTGALIAGDAPAVGDQLAAVIISLPSAGCLVGRGRILRAIGGANAADPPTFAVAVERYRIQPRAAALNAAVGLLQRWYARS